MRLLQEEATGSPHQVAHVPRRVRYIRQDTKIAVAVRDEGKCTRCGSRRNLHYHHVKPFAAGGRNTKDNLRLLCRRCHKKVHQGTGMKQDMHVAGQCGCPCPECSRKQVHCYRHASDCHKGCR